MSTSLFSRPRFGWLILLAITGLIGAAPRGGSTDLPELNRKVVEFARGELGKKVGDGSCATLAVVALGRAGARRFPIDEGGDGLAWGTEVAGPKEALPGDIVQFRDAEFRGRRTLSGGRWVSWRYRYPKHTAIVASVGRGGKVLGVLHQNVGPEEADDSAKKIVQEGTLRMDSLQPGGRVRIYRPVLAREVGASPAAASGGLFEGAFPRAFGRDWAWVDEPAWSWRVESGTLVVRPAAAGARGEPEGRRGLLLRTLSGIRDDSVSIEVTLESRPADPLESAGLVCRSGDGPGVCLVKNGGEGGGCLRLVPESDAGPSSSAARTRCDSARVDLRMLFWGGVVTGQYRTGRDEAWQTVGRGTLPARGTLDVGLVAGFGTRPSGREVRFRDLRIARQLNSRRGD